MMREKCGVCEESVLIFISISLHPSDSAFSLCYVYRYHDTLSVFPILYVIHIGAQFMKFCLYIGSSACFVVLRCEGNLSSNSGIIQ